MVINNIEIDFNVFDLEQAEKFDLAVKTLQAEEAEASEVMRSGDIAQGVKSLYSAYKNFFINCVGQDVVGDVNDALKAQSFVIEFKDKFVDSAKKIVDDSRV